MKLKEKLAQEFSDRAYGEAKDEIPAYIAGFEKARELAKSDVIEWLEVTGVIPKGTSYYNELVNGLDVLGEEEMKE